MRVTCAKIATSRLLPWTAIDSGASWIPSERLGAAVWHFFQLLLASDFVTHYRIAGMAPWKGFKSVNAQALSAVLLSIGIPMVSTAAPLLGPLFLGSIPKIAGTGAAGILVSGNVAYVASGTNGLVILDVSNPDRPVPVGGLPAIGTAADVFVRGSFAFVACAASGRDAGSLQIIDIQDPHSPRLVGSRRGDTLGVVANDTNVYIAAGISGLLALDYSNPTKPTVTGGYDTPRNATSARIFNNRLYVTDSFAGLYIFDLTDPGKPVRVSNYDSSGYLGDVWVEANLAYLADGASGLGIVDLSDPSSPTLVGRLASVKFASRVLISGNLACVATGSGWQVVDVTNPAEPVLIGLYQLNGGIGGTAVHGDRFLVTDEGGGLSVFAENPDQVPQELALLSPTWDRTLGFSALIPVNPGVYVLEMRPDANAPWVKRTSFGVPTPGVRRLIDANSTDRPVGFYRVSKSP